MDLFSEVQNESITRFELPPLPAFKSKLLFYSNSMKKINFQSPVNMTDPYYYF